MGRKTIKTATMIKIVTTMMTRRRPHHPRMGQSPVADQSLERKDRSPAKRNARSRGPSHENDLDQSLRNVRALAPRNETGQGRRNDRVLDPSPSRKRSALAPNVPDRNPRSAAHRNLDQARAGGRHPGRGPNLRKKGDQNRGSALVLENGLR